MDIDPLEGELRLIGRVSERTRVDVAVLAPPDLTLVLRLDDGSAALRRTGGDQVVRARGVVGRDVRGTLEVEAGGEGVDLELFPDGDCTVFATGPVVVALPFGLDLHLVLHPDPDWGVSVADLGFRDFVETDRLVEGIAGEGSVRVELSAAGGDLVVLEANP